MTPMTMVTVLVLLAIFAFCWGGYTIACEVRQCPDGKVSKALIGASRVKAIKPKTLWSGFLQSAARKLSRFVPLDDLRWEKIQNALSIAGGKLYPKGICGKSNRRSIGGTILRSSTGDV